MSDVMTMKRKKGFTLVEIMIVVAIIALVAAISIPSLMRARLNAHDRAAQGDLRTFRNAIENFRAAQSPPSYPSAITALTTANPWYLDDTWDNVPLVKHNHTMIYTVGAGAEPTTYSVTAQFIPNESAAHFCVDQNGVMMMSAEDVMPAADGAGCNGAGWIPMIT